jgi:RecA/RadA recombinase
MSDLQDIDGIGNGVEEKLIDVGITSVNALANSSVEDVKDAGVRRAETIVERARKQGVQIDSGQEVEQEQKNTRHISTGMQDLDAILDDGLQGGFLIGVSGEPKAGKTQFVLQMLAAATDFTDGHAVYIETEPNRFQIDRVKSLCRKEDSYERVHRIQAYSPEDDVDNLDLQMNAYDATREAFDNVSLVVVDSFQSNFRLSGDFQGRADLPDRNSAIADHLNSLQSLAEHYDCPVLMTLQVMGNPDQFSSGHIEVWGSVLMDHTIAHLIHISHAKGQLREASVKGHPGLPDKSITIKMPEDEPIEVA